MVVNATLKRKLSIKMYYKNKNIDFFELKKFSWTQSNEKIIVNSNLQKGLRRCNE